MSCETVPDFLRPKMFTTIVSNTQVYHFSNLKNNKILLNIHSNITFKGRKDPVNG